MSGYITIELEKGTDLDQIRFEVAMLIRQLYPKLPKDVSYPSIQLNSPQENTKQESFMTLQLSGNTEPTILNTYANEQLKPTLASIEGKTRLFYLVLCLQDSHTRLPIVKHRHHLPSIHESGISYVYTLNFAHCLEIKLGLLLGFDDAIGAELEGKRLGGEGCCFNQTLFRQYLYPIIFFIFIDFTTRKVQQ
jgi:hypothetical protein